MEKMELHSGHRQRMRDKVANDNFERLNDHEFLESLLYFVIPRKDTNPLAHLLIDSFGSLTNIFLATKQQLMQVNGVSENTAQFLICLPKLARRIAVSPSHLEKLITSNDFAEFFEKYFRGAKEELLYVAFTRENNTLIVCKMVSHGSTGKTSLNIREILDLSLKLNAKNVALAHNHPSQTCQASEDDIISSAYLSQALKAIDVRLIDHIIFGTDGCASFIYTINEVDKQFLNQRNLAIQDVLNMPQGNKIIDYKSIDAYLIADLD